MFEPVPGTQMMMTTRDLMETITTIPRVVHFVEIPAGYRFDGASIPRLAWSIIGAPFEPDFCKAACIHDWYCEKSIEHGRYQDRVIGDAVFFSLLERAGVPRWKRVLMYLAVRGNSWWRYGRKHVSGTVAVETPTPAQTPVPERGTRADWFEDAD